MKDTGNRVTRLPVSLRCPPTAPRPSRPTSTLCAARRAPWRGAGTYRGGQTRRDSLAGLSARPALRTLGAATVEEEEEVGCAFRPPGASQYLSAA